MGQATDLYAKGVAAAESYLRGRDLWDDDVLVGYRLGVVGDEHFPEHRHVVGRLAIPYLTPGGVVNMKFRCIEDHDCKAEEHAKYLGTVGAEDRLYNVQALHDADDTIYVTEGELDAITATVAGFPAVGISGASKWADHYGKLFEDFAEVIVLGDGDAAGEKFADMVLREVEHARPVFMPDDEDVNSVVVEFGDKRLREIIEEAKR